ncbi:hypothetical protein BS50DRAFT_479419 [Corynespora cassiicola Philippines]|uniref:Gfd2/YDR514C-like C-terminal domain-containing protein n=1 Tax=Corynespora cassiicola Philippines TaxID=1448308 RepID=A0A2T2PD14_CORCC|nr:hypothetical protein BS50DRAFT_479419 [Corynespora cassiicola Philippines]
MDVARQFASTRSHADLLRFALGMHIDGAPEIAQNAVVNVLDCESFEHDHGLLTEVGLVSFERCEMVEAFKDPGPHGENILKRMYFYHLRLISNAHFVNRQWCPGDPEKNHFGNTRFLTHSEVKSALNEAFAWPLDPNDPSKGNCPVFFMGHAVSNDLRMLQDSVGFDAAALGTVVATLDTQQIARDVGIRGRGHQIGLQTLAGFFGVQYRDPHTACNDAAYTIIAAVQMVLNNIPPSDKSLQSVVEDLEVSSQAELTTWGISKYCTCCGQAGHLRFRCALKDRLFCNRCAAAGRENAAHSHIDEMCSRIH